MRFWCQYTIKTIDFCTENQQFCTKNRPFCTPNPKKIACGALTSVQGLVIYIETQVNCTPNIRKFSPAAHLSLDTFAQNPPSFVPRTHLDPPLNALNHQFRPKPPKISGPGPPTDETLKMNNFLYGFSLKNHGGNCSLLGPPNASAPQAKILGVLSAI